MSRIVLINPGGCYKAVVQRFVDAIGQHIDGANYSATPIPGGFNVHFFRHYLDRGKPRECPDLYIAHGWNQKLTPKGSPNYRAYSLFRYFGVVGEIDRAFLIRHGVEPERLLTVGHPGMDEILSGGQEPIPLEGKKPRIVAAYSHSAFAPTWATMPSVFKRRLREEFELIDLYHPVYHLKRKRTGLARDWLLGASACLTDVSGAMFEAWSLGVPVVFPTFIQGARAMALPKTAPLRLIYEHRIGYHTEKSIDFMPAVRAAVRHGMMDRETEFIDRYFPKELRGCSGKQAAREIERVAEQEEA